MLCVLFIFCSMEYRDIELVIGVETSIQRGYDAEKNAPSLIARIDLRLPKAKGSNKLHSVLSWGSRMLVLGQEITKNTTELSCWQSYPYTIQGEREARRWIKIQKYEALQQLRAIKREYYELEQASKYNEYSEETI